MISNAFLAGKLGEVFIDSTGEYFRYVILDAINSYGEEKCQRDVHKVAVHAFGPVNSSFYSIPNGSYVVIRGWIETRENLGAVVISEIEDLFPHKA